jgi:hypothetical protein
MTCHARRKAGRQVALTNVKGQQPRDYPATGNGTSHHRYEQLLVGWKAGVTDQREGDATTMSSDKRGVRPQHAPMTPIVAPALPVLASG